MGNVIHETEIVQVGLSIDKGVAEVVRYLNTIPGVLTHASCQGTIGEGGPQPYEAQVMVTWPNEEILARLQQEFDVTISGDSFGYVHPKDRIKCPDCHSTGRTDTGNFCLCLKGHELYEKTQQEQAVAVPGEGKL